MLGDALTSRRTPGDGSILWHVRIASQWNKIINFHYDGLWKALKKLVSLMVTLIVRVDLPPKRSAISDCCFKRCQIWGGNGSIFYKCLWSGQVEVTPPLRSAWLLNRRFLRLSFVTYVLWVALNFLSCADLRGLGMFHSVSLMIYWWSSLSLVKFWPCCIRLSEKAKSGLT